MKMIIRFALFLSLFAFCHDADVSWAIAADKPNIIYILADDLGYGDLGCYGQRLIETPHLDRMAAQGMRFTQLYAGNTVCEWAVDGHGDIARSKNGGEVADGNGWVAREVVQVDDQYPDC